MKRTSILIALILLPVSVISAETIRVAVSANFLGPVKRLKTLFESKSEHRLSISPGSSGALYAQIHNGAPYDLFLSADQSTVEKLVHEGKADGHSRFSYAVGRLVLWSPNPGRVLGPETLKSQFRHLAIANPRVAPYGQAAESVLRRLRVRETVEKRLVLGENLTQVHQFIVGGNADFGFLALSQIVDESGHVSEGSFWIVPPDMYPPLLQDAVLLTGGSQKEAARSFLSFIKTPHARRMIEICGYGLP